MCSSFVIILFKYVYILCMQVKSSVASESPQESVFIFIHHVLFPSCSGVQNVGTLGFGDKMCKLQERLWDKY